MLTDPHLNEQGNTQHVHLLTCDHSTPIHTMKSISSGPVVSNSISIQHVIAPHQEAMSFNSSTDGKEIVHVLSAGFSIPPKGQNQIRAEVTQSNSPGPDAAATFELAPSNSTTITPMLIDTKPSQQSELIMLETTQNIAQADANAPASKRGRFGLELVGSCVSVKWPDDGQFYEARVVRFLQESGQHTVAYEHDGEYCVETFNMNNRKRKWKHLPEPFPWLNDDPLYGLVGKVIGIDMEPEDTPEEALSKTAVVLDARQESPTYWNWTRWTEPIKKPPLLHKVIFQSDLFLVDVDFSEHMFTVLR